MKVEDRLRSALEQEALRYDDWVPRSTQDAMRRGRQRRNIKQVGVPVLAVLGVLVLVWGSLSVGRELADPPEPIAPSESTDRVVSVSLPDSALEAYVTVDSEETCLAVTLSTDSGNRESRWCEPGNPEFMGVRDAMFDVPFVAVQTQAGIDVTLIWDQTNDTVDFESATENGQTVTLAVGEVQNRASVQVSGPGIFLDVELDSEAGVLESLALLPRLGEEPSVFASVHDMREKLGRDGFDCDRWHADSLPGVRNRGQNEQESAVCTLYSHFMVFFSSIPGTEVSQMVRQTHDIYARDGQTSAVVYGDNWLVDCSGNVVECEAIHHALGGTIEVVEGDPDLRDGDLLPALACPALPAEPPGEPIAFFALCNGDPGLPPVPVYRTSAPSGIEEAVRSLVAGTTSEERDAGYESGYDWIVDSAELTVDVGVDSVGVARVTITDDGELWQPGDLAGTSHQLLLLIDPLMATMFQYPEVTAVDMSTLCWGEADCSGITTRELWESTLFINTGALFTSNCDLEAVWYDQDHCTLIAAIGFQHFEWIRQDNSDTVAMHAGPGVDYVLVAELQPGEQVAVLENSTTGEEGDEWELIIPSSTDQAGWVLADVLNPTEP